MTYLQTATALPVFVIPMFMHRSRKFRQVGKPFSSRQRISQRALRTSLEKQLASQRGPYQYFLKKHIATCDLAGGGGG